ncbi:MAG: DNA polymerase III subunit delta [Calditrichaeota bacterium]|nr:DNA polymerase III subunit delta [Candidatus Cloacimonadota bacterium]MCB1046747.1 DNA polymerase III subunit delta [Calditrichota bacterium]
MTDPARLLAEPLAPLQLLVGEEDLLLEQALAVFHDGVVDPALADFNRDVFQADEVSGEHLFRLAASFPMMSPRRLVIVRGMERASAALLDDLRTYIKNPSPSTILVLTAGSVDGRKSVWKELRKVARVVEFPLLDGAILPGWMQEACQAQGLELPQAQAAALAEHLVGASLRTVSQELEKLALLSAAENRTVIDADLLATVLGTPREVSLFSLTDAVLERNAARCCAILKELLTLAQNEYTLLPALSKSFGRLWVTASLRDSGHDAAAVARVLEQRNSWVANRNLQQLRHWSASSLAAACRLLRDADGDLKGGSALPNSIRLNQLIVELCRL